LNFLRSISSLSWQALTRIGIALLAAFIVGLMFGRVAAMLAIALALILAFQLWSFIRVDRWVRRRRLEEPPDIDGAWGELIAVIDRIYRRKQYHKSQVNELLREFRRLTTAMPEGAILLGPDHEILWFNRRAADWLHLRRKRDFGIRIENLVRHPSFVQYLRAESPDGGVVVYEPGDSNRWLHFSVVRTGGPERQLLILRDVSREMQLESMRKDFVANASHELRSPLTVISGYLDALADDEKLDATWNSPVQEMRRQAERMSTIINDLLELSKLESGARRSADQPIDIGGMLALARREISAPDHRSQTIKLTLESNDWLLGVEREIHSVVANLLSNAAKYTPPEGEIDLKWWTDEEGGHVSVRDTGVGIAEEHIPRLTERFYRVDSGRSRDMGGSGLGLAIVKHALQRHQATLTINSQQGIGSTFTCHFPPSRILPRPSVDSVDPDGRRSAGV
jgi:two-component system phosphate regulon sensor histidine kinase PhoR